MWKCVSRSALALMLVSGCTGGASEASGAGSGEASASPPASGTPTPTGPDDAWLDQLVPVGGGRKLHATCWGHGSPAVINVHGRIMPYDDASWAHSVEQREAIAPHTTYCEYERTNVGTSSPEAGPIPLTQSA